MQAFAKTLDKAWKDKWGMDSLEYHSFSDTQNAHRGHPMGQPPKTKGALFKLLYLLYVDNGAFLFESKAALTQGEPN